MQDSEVDSTCMQEFGEDITCMLESGNRKSYESNLEEKLTQFSVPDYSLSSQGSHSDKDLRELATLACSRKRGQ